ncbi:hypothetical protein KP509_06G072400 [Ceratopteris richardii]|uniref:Di19 zinc-binding domain-containing protein n=1 Tax=Ceratopteris richardii TaxID=49495 RepID=A0A8T2UP17_CERRI|nr:hypothetical protein KP509_06G072400 [Ceratopteris richardii]
MDSELWASLLSATKRRLALHPYRLDRILSHDDSDIHDNIQIEFPCPFCGGEFDIGSLCFHIEEEHCFESKAVVCPVCSIKVKNDLVGHIAIQHGHLLKMQHRRFRMAVTSVGSALSSIAKERGMMTVEVHPNGNNLWSLSSSSQNGSDPLVNILFGLPPTENVETDKPPGSGSDKECIMHQTDSVTAISTSEVESKEHLKEALLRATFVQQLVLSSVFQV